MSEITIGRVEAALELIESFDVRLARIEAKLDSLTPGVLYYTTETAAVAVGMTPTGIRDAITSSKIEASKNGSGHYMITPAELERFANARSNGR